MAAGGSRSILTRLQGALQGASVAIQARAAGGGGERSTLDRAWKLIDRVVKLCQQPVVNLKNRSATSGGGASFEASQGTAEAQPGHSRGTAGAQPGHDGLEMGHTLIAYS